MEAMEEMVRMVRKHGSVAIKEKGAATQLVEYAKNEFGYTFKARIQGWNHIVTDEDL